jgi:hypothetical protein
LDRIGLKWDLIFLCVLRALRVEKFFIKMSEKAKLKQVAPSFVVADVVKTAEYYRDELGFNILGYFLDPPVFAMVARDGVEFHFGKGDEGKEVQVNESVRKGLGTDAYIFVDDVQALYEELREKNVEIVEGPVRRVYDCIELTVRDCNGFQLVFGQ